MTDTNSKIEAAKSRIRKALISVAVMTGVGAPGSANAQSTMHVGSDGKVTYSKVTNVQGSQRNLAMAQQQSGAVRTAPQGTFNQVRAQQPQQVQAQQAQMALWNSLPRHVKDEISVMGYELDVQYSVKLNNALTPESHNKRFILYSCAVRDVRQPGKIIFLPYHQTYPNNPNQAMRPLVVSEQSAVNNQTRSSGAYQPQPNRFPTNTYSINLGNYGRYEVNNKGKVEPLQEDEKLIIKCYE